ncbi:MAG: type II secretion system F family protein [Planctomycetes bacterium]|nr:type II secretion system F family protein [Planctomycetota bacterium]
MVTLLAEFDLMLVASCLPTGCGAGLLSWWVLRALASDDLPQEAEWRYDVSRINTLRRLDPIYRILQTPLQLLARLNRAAFSRQLSEVYREILAAGLPRHWLPEEYLARTQLLALLAMPGIAYACWNMIGPSGWLSALLLTVLLAWWFRRRLTLQARRRLLLIKRRMPFLLDLLTLLMEAGASFLNALQQGVHEFGEHPIGREFGRVLADMQMGKPRTEAFDNLRRRLNDDEITSIVGAIIQSEELGTPLAHIFRTQADVLRVKRSQRAETIAGEAGVNMLLPAILIMASTVLIILGPFLLNYLYFEF